MSVKTEFCEFCGSGPACCVCDAEEPAAVAALRQMLDCLEVDNPTDDPEQWTYHLRGMVTDAVIASNAALAAYDEAKA